MKEKVHPLIVTIIVDLYKEKKKSCIKVIESFKKLLWTFKDECNAKAWNCERANKGIANFVCSCVDFAFANIGSLHHTFICKHLIFSCKFIKCCGRFDRPFNGHHSFSVIFTYRIVVTFGRFLDLLMTLYFSILWSYKCVGCYGSYVDLLITFNIFSFNHKCVGCCGRSNIRPFDDLYHSFFFNCKFFIILGRYLDLLMIFITHFFHVDFL